MQLNGFEEYREYYYAATNSGLIKKQNYKAKCKTLLDKIQLYLVLLESLMLGFRLDQSK